jgi:hypothetical protein
MGWTPHLSRTIAVLTGLVVAVSLGRSEAATPSPTSASMMGAAASACPKHALRLPGIGVADAAEQALNEAAHDYRGADTRHAQVLSADRSAFAGARGSQVRQQCGAKVARRTVVVQLLFPKMLPSASLSEGVVFVARFPRGYRVWEMAH